MPECLPESPDVVEAGTVVPEVPEVVAGTVATVAEAAGSVFRHSELDLIESTRWTFR